MKIYFAGSIRGGRDDKELYLEIIEILQQYGDVLTEHIGEASLGSFGETGLSDYDIYQRDMNWLKNSDLIVAEVTNPSLGVGFEIGQALMMNKRVICLYRKIDEKRLSAMIAGCDLIENFEYETIDEVRNMLREIF